MARGEEKGVEADLPWSVSNSNSSNSSNSSGLLNESMAVSLPSLVTIMDYPAVTPLYIFLCCVAWLFCVVGNCLVLTVMIRSPSLRTRTNLFLCHLAAADLSVGLICIVPNMVVAAKIFHWFPDPAGRVLCKLYNFFEEFSLTASVLLLVLIAAERYVAIIYPLKARQLFTRWRMYTSLMVVWTAAALYNIPLLMIYETATIEDGHTYCYRYDTDQQPIRMDIYHVLTFLLTYVLPLLLMGSMYLRVSLTLWKSSPVSMLQVNERQGGAIADTGKTPQAAVLDTKRTDQETKTKDTESRNSSITSHTSHTSCSSCSTSKSHKPGSDPALTDHTRPGPESTRPLLLPWRSDPGSGGNLAVPLPHPAADVPKCPICARKIGTTSTPVPLSLPKATAPMLPGLNTGRMRDGVYAVRYAAASSNSACRFQVTAHRVLQSRRKVIRLLVAVLLVFACCVLPFHLRLLLRYGLHMYLMRPLGLLELVSQLLFFLNSALNPVLYSLMSHSFRRSARQVLCLDSRPQRH